MKQNHLVPDIFLLLSFLTMAVLIILALPTEFTPSLPEIPTTWPSNYTEELGKTCRLGDLDGDQENSTSISAFNKNFTGSTPGDLEVVAVEVNGTKFAVIVDEDYRCDVSKATDFNFSLVPGLCSLITQNLSNPTSWMSGLATYSKKVDEITACSIAGDIFPINGTRKSIETIYGGSKTYAGDGLNDVIIATFPGINKGKLTTTTGAFCTVDALIDCSACGIEDNDGDGIPDSCDNCNTIANSNQQDSSLTGIGDGCVIGEITSTNLVSLTENISGNGSVIVSSEDASVVEFIWNSSKILNFSEVSIFKESAGASQGSLIISGINLTGTGQTKTVYVNVISEEDELCIKDAEITSISEISSDCSSPDEFLIDCPGSSGPYACTVEGSRYKITGLTFSGIIESSTTPTTSSTSSSGGAGRSLTCKIKWQCNDWGRCVNSIQTRNCFDANLCNDTIIVDGRSYPVFIFDGDTPKESRSCVNAINERLEVTPSCNDFVKNQDEEGIDCGGPCKQCTILERMPKAIQEIKEKMPNVFYIGLTVILSGIALIVLGIWSTINFLLRKALNTNKR